MRRVLKGVLACAVLASSIQAEQRLIVRASGGQLTMNAACLLAGCNVVRALDDPLSQLFLVTVPDVAYLPTVLQTLTNISGIAGAEPDRLARLSNTRPPIPSALYDNQQTAFYGVNAHAGYTRQPAVQIVRLSEARSAYAVAGGVTVAVIDTGVDTTHPVLQPVLLPGYDYTRGSASGSEQGDVDQSTAAVVNGVPPVFVNNSAAAIVDQSTAAVVNDPDHAAFGHGTMVAGIIRLVAPRSKILPLKAFKANGTGYTSDILRAIYRAVRDGARVLNMSFSMDAPSRELERALDHAFSSGAICVASAGNSGQATSVYPAAWSTVIGVASTANDDRRSSFSNYGANLVSMAAPGEGIVTTYPFGSYAAAWGTSFSTPFVSGTVALLMEAAPALTSSQLQTALGQALPLGPELGRGRLDVLRAVEAARITP